jgi:RHS repeat-associated protein
MPPRGRAVAQLFYYAGQERDRATGLALHDGHGSTRALLDATAGVVKKDGTIDQLFVYDAYGNLLNLSGFATAIDQALTTLLYSGEQTDRTGLQYLRARYYDPRTGRFNRLDPFGGNIEDPQSLHKYLYTHGDPVNGVDPSGELLVALGILATLASFFNIALVSAAASIERSESEILLYSDPLYRAVDSQEVAPGSPAPFRSGIEAMLDEDVFHRLPANGTDAELFQLAQNPRVSPARLLGDHDDQLPHEGSQPRPAYSRRRGSTFFLADPTAKRGIADDRDELADARAEFLAQL